MLRDKSLVSLSRQHQHALALCVRIDRAQPIRDDDLETWQAEIDQHFQQEIGVHFSAEERIVFPAARQFPELVPIVEGLVVDHVSLRESFAQAQARRMSAQDLPVFGQRLSSHIRKEERELFERLQVLLNAEQLAALGERLEDALKDAAQFCATTGAGKISRKC